MYGAQTTKQSCIKLYVGCTLHVVGDYANKTDSSLSIGVVYIERVNA